MAPSLSCPTHSHFKSQEKIALFAAVGGNRGVDSGVVGNKAMGGVLWWRADHSCRGQDIVSTELLNMQAVWKHHPLNMCHLASKKVLFKGEYCGTPAANWTSAYFGSILIGMVTVNINYHYKH